ncbi:MAG: hypothetical protein RLN81_13795 [Balneolaceae bacterium]
MEKPNRYKFTEYWGTRILIFWYVFLVIVGLIFIELPDGLIFPLMGALAAKFSIHMGQQVLRFQKKNSGHMKRGLYDSAVFFFWLFGILGTTLFLTGAIISIFESYEILDKFFFLSSSLFPLGIAIGASKQWEMREVFKV